MVEPGLDLHDGGEADPGDVAAAIEGYRELYEYLETVTAALAPSTGLGEDDEAPGRLP